jgi:hypothetical protein|tara:strand:+ start:764 stop:880 length:117 start_codon:yes stop_codon:yes gene_type:complete
MIGRQITNIGSDSELLKNIAKEGEIYISTGRGLKLFLF